MIPPTQEAEARGSQVQGLPVLQIEFRTSMGWEYGSVVEHFPRLSKAIGSIPSTRMGGKADTCNQFLTKVRLCGRVESPPYKVGL